jgi:hypothetical protein
VEGLEGVDDDAIDMFLIAVDDEVVALCCCYHVVEVKNQSKM